MIAIFSGLIAGTLHVWSGPDHMAAVGPLAAYRSRRPWVAGVRWGVGHSAGVIVVGLLSLWFRDVFPVGVLSMWGERLVGVMLVGIGCWGLRKALRNHVHTHAHQHDGSRHVHIHVHSSTPHTNPLAHQHTHTAFGIGILHGVAGSSHFLGVLPVLAFPTTSQALLYLAAFGVGTVCAMVSFTWVIGWISAKWTTGGGYRALMSGCSVAAIVVGCVWLLKAFAVVSGA